MMSHAALPHRDVASDTMARMTDLPAWDAPDVPGAGPTPGPVATAAPSTGRRLLPLRPLAAGELLDGPVTVTRAFPKVVLAFGAVLALVASAADLLATLLVIDSVSVSPGEGLSSDLVGASAFSTGVSLVVGLLTGAVMSGVMTSVVGHAVLGGTTTLRQAWTELRPRFLKLLGLSLLISTAVYGAFFGSIALLVLLLLAGPAGALVGVPLVLAGAAAAVWLYVRWSLAPAVLVLERTGVREALRRSSLLVRRAFWSVVGVLLLALLITFVVSLVVQLPFQLLGYNPFGGFSSTYELTTRDAVVGAVASTLASTLVIPYAAGVRALLYVDRRVRAEALDVTLTAALEQR